MSLNGRELLRQFRLVSTAVRDGGATIEGTYRETLWGYAMEPSTVDGLFSLQRPVYASFAPKYPTYLPILMKQ